MVNGAGAAEADCLVGFTALGTLGGFIIGGGFATMGAGAWYGAQAGYAAGMMVCIP